MLTQLRASRADQSYDRKLARFVAPDLLILGETGGPQLAADSRGEERGLERVCSRVDARAHSCFINVDCYTTVVREPQLAGFEVDPDWPVLRCSPRLPATRGCWECSSRS